jgi:hypothetical protein
MTTENHFEAGLVVTLTKWGVVIRTDELPPVDAVLDLNLKLPGGEEPVSARAIVRQNVARGFSRGFRAEFIDLDPEVRRRIVHYLRG